MRMYIQNMQHMSQNNIHCSTGDLIKRYKINVVCHCQLFANLRKLRNLTIIMVIYTRDHKVGRIWQNKEVITLIM